MHGFRDVHPVPGGRHPEAGADIARPQRDREIRPIIAAGGRDRGEQAHREGCQARSRTTSLRATFMSRFPVGPDAWAIGSQMAFEVLNNGDADLHRL